MRAVGSLLSDSLQRQTVAPRATPRSDESEPATSGPSEDPSARANAAESVGGKGPDGFAIRAPGGGDENNQDETQPAGGKGQESPSDLLQRDDGDSGDANQSASGGKPPGLSKKTVQGPTANDRGGYNWVVQWELDKPSPAGGWIVQGVNVTGDVKDKDGKPLKTGWEAHVPYWEAWQVHAGQKVTTYAEGGDVMDDTFANPSYAEGSKGQVSETGSPQFYEGLTLPSSFKANGVAPAGILPATKSDPSLSGGSGTIPHEMKATWDSSKGENKTTITTS